MDTYLKLRCDTLDSSHAMPGSLVAGSHDRGTPKACNNEQSCQEGQALQRSASHAQKTKYLNYQTWLQALLLLSITHWSQRQGLYKLETIEAKRNDTDDWHPMSCAARPADFVLRTSHIVPQDLIRQYQACASRNGMLNLTRPLQQTLKAHRQQG